MESAAPVAPELSSTIAPIDGETVEYALGGALAALVLGGAALAASRRRRRGREDDLSESLAVPSAMPAAPIARHDPLPQTVASDRPAFAWGQQASGQQAPASSRMTPTALAKIGPTPENPSLSLKKRLKRAAFFEQRDRAAAAGKAVPVPRIAGIPQRAVEALRNAATAKSHRPVFQPA